MVSSTDAIISKLAVAMKLITPQDLHKCTLEQQQLDFPKPISIIMLEKGLITKEQLKMLHDKTQIEEERHDLRFSRVAIALGFLDEATLTKAQDIQKQEVPKKSLRIILVEHSFITNQQAQIIFNNLKLTKMLLCKQCQKKYSMSPYIEGKVYECPDCKIQLVGDIEEEKEKKEELRLYGAAKGLTFKVGEEKEDDLCGKRVGDYNIQKLLGAGAMGVVYKAEQIKLRRTVAIKMLSESLCGDTFYIKRFMVEARSAAQLNHPNILQIYDADSYEGRFFFAMEYLKGNSIGEILDRMNKIPLENAVDIVLQIAKALTETYEHKIVHRDIKPDNIMLTPKGIAKLADLGLAKSNIDYAKEMESAESGMIMGTPYYAPPEQIKNTKEVDTRADIYSLGASFYRMITGVIPFFHHDPRVVLRKVTVDTLPLASEIDNTIPHSIAWVISKMLEKKPKDRFQTPEELIDILEGIQAQELQKRAGGLSEQEKSSVLVSQPIAQPFGLSTPPPPPPTIAPPVSGANLDFEESFNQESKTTHPMRDPMFDFEESKEKPEEAKTEIKTEVKKAVPKEQVKKTKTGPIKRQGPIRQQSQQKESGTNVPMVAALIGIIIVITIFLYPKKKPVKKKVVKPPVKITEAEKKAKAYAHLVTYCTKTIQTMNLKEVTSALKKIESFEKKYKKRSYNKNKKLKYYKKEFTNFINIHETKLEMAKIQKEILKMIKKKHYNSAENTLQKRIKKIDAKIATEEITKLQQAIEVAAKKHYEALYQKYKHKTIKIRIKGLETAKKRQTKKYRIKLQEDIKKIKEDIQYTKNAILKLSLTEQIYKALDNLNFSKAREIIEIERFKSPAIIKEFKKDIDIVENLDKLYISVLNDELKKGYFTYVFSKANKRKKVTAKVYRVSKRNIMLLKKGTRAVVSNSIDNLTWKYKRKILRIRNKRNKEFYYKLAIQELVNQNLKYVDKELTIMPKKYYRITTEKKIYVYLAMLKDALKKKEDKTKRNSFEDENPSKVEKIIKILNQKHHTEKIWLTLKNYIAKKIFYRIRKTNPRYKKRYYKIIVNNLKETPPYKKAKKALMGGKFHECKSAKKTSPCKKAKKALVIRISL